MKCKIGMFSGGTLFEIGSTTGYAVSGSTEEPDANGTYCADGTFNLRPVYSNANGWHLFYGVDNEYEQSGWVIASTEPTDNSESPGWNYVLQGDDAATPPTDTYPGYFQADDVTVSITTGCP